MKILLKVSYLGTNYKGYQLQKNDVTIQGCLNDAVKRVYGESLLLTGCSRTDRGVHANEFYCMLEMNQFKIPINRISIALSDALPKDISVLDAKIVSDDFHVRYDVLYKEYEYLIWNNINKNPFLSDRAYHYSINLLDINVMNQAAQEFIGKHDFEAFMCKGSKIESTVREIKYFNVLQKDEFIKIVIAADGFLYNMVRILVGTLVYVSEGKIKIEGIPNIIESKDRTRAGYTAPAHGLYLNKVVFKNF